jgi:putative heme-binding domain-containing protein
MAQSGLKEAPGSWVDALRLVLGEGDAALVREAVAAVRALPVKGEEAGRLGAELLEIADRESSPPETRLEALAAVPGGLAAVSPPLFVFLRAQLDPGLPVATRSAAVEVLSKAKLTRKKLIALTETIPTVGPLEVSRLIATFGQTPDEEIGLKLVAALGRSSAVSTLRTESLKLLLAKYPARVQEQASSLYAKLDADAAQQRAKLEGMLSALSSGDIRRGQAVFNSTKAACAACHEIGYMGGHVGPDLTRIGRIRNGRDLLEAIAFPSASFVRSYEPVAIATRDGKVYNGVIRKDAADEVVLAIGVNEEARVARADIEEIRPSTVSVMPAGLDQQLTLQELADLVAFLQACK